MTDENARHKKNATVDHTYAIYHFYGHLAAGLFHALIIYCTQTVGLLIGSLTVKPFFNTKLPIIPLYLQY